MNGTETIHPRPVNGRSNKVGHSAGFRVRQVARDKGLISSENTLKIVVDNPRKCDIIRLYFEVNEGRAVLHHRPELKLG